jgi:hypothetical protein
MKAELYTCIVVPNPRPIYNESEFKKSELLVFFIFSSSCDIGKPLKYQY